uniref:Uncharacterized protein n=1 Tax=Parascaris univalens TaxID=6257 RepID=A0A915C074_PARUN
MLIGVCTKHRYIDVSFYEILYVEIVSNKMLVQMLRLTGVLIRNEERFLEGYRMTSDVVSDSSVQPVLLLVGGGGDAGVVKGVDEDSLTRRLYVFAGEGA